MDKNLRRWYEQNEYLKAFMDLMQDCDVDYQCEIAVDIIMQVSKISERDYTKMIEEVSSYDPKDYKRWYDVNPNLHIAIEALRDIEEDKAVEIIQEFIDKILLDRDELDEILDEESDEEFYANRDEIEEKI